MATRSQADRRGYLYAFLAALCAGAVPTLSKILLPPTGPVVLSSLTFLLSGLFIVPYQPRRLPNRQSLPILIFFGILGAAIAPVVYQSGLQSTTAVNASLLANGEVLFTGLLAFAFFGEKLSRGQLARGLIIVVGIVVVSTNLDLAGVGFLQGVVGNLLILGATLGWAVENNLLTSAAQRFGPVMVTKYRNLIGGGILLVVAEVAGIRFGLSGWQTIELVLLSVLVGATSVLSIAALGKIGAIRTILVFSSSTIFGAVFAFFYLGEQITVVQIVGGALILIGVYAFQSTEKALLYPTV